MKITFDKNSSATYSGFSQITPPPDTRRQELINRIRSAEEQITEFKDETGYFQKRRLYEAKEHLDLAKLDLALHDAGMSEREGAAEAFHINQASKNISNLKTTTGLELVTKALIKAAASLNK